MKIVLALSLAAVLCGCAIKPLAPEDAKGIPTSRVAQKGLLIKSAGAVEVRFIREEAVITGTGSSANLFLNETPLARMLSGEIFSIWLRPGIYAIGLRTSERWVPDHIAFSRPDLALAKVEIDPREGRRYDVRIDFANWTGRRLTASSSIAD